MLPHIGAAHIMLKELRLLLAAHMAASIGMCVIADPGMRWPFVCLAVFMVIAVAATYVAGNRHYKGGKTNV